MQFSFTASTKKSSSLAFSMAMEESKFHSSVANTFLNVFKRTSPLRKATTPKLFKKHSKSSMIFCRANEENNYYAISQSKTGYNLLKIAR